MNIGIDIDDTISNTFEISLPIAEKYVKNVLKKDVKPDFSNVIDHFYIKNIFKLTKEEDLEFWDKNYTAVTKAVKPKESAVKVINKLKKEGNNIFIITARWDTESASAYEVSKKWLEENNICYDKLIIGADDKGEIAKELGVDIFIDDSSKHCESVSKQGIKTYIFTSVMNKNYKAIDFDRVNSWDEFYEKVKEVN